MMRGLTSNMLPTQSHLERRGPFGYYIAGTHCTGGFGMTPSKPVFLWENVLMFHITEGYNCRIIFTVFAQKNSCFRSVGFLVAACVLNKSQLFSHPALEPIYSSI